MKGAALMLFVHLLLVALYSIEVLAVLAMVLLGLDMAWWLFHNPEAKAARAAKPKKLTIQTNVQKLIETTREKQAKRKAEAEERRKARLRAAKEAEAWLGFDTAEYFHGFDREGALIYRGATAPTGQDWEFFSKKQDEIADEAIFTLTEDL